MNKLFCFLLLLFTGIWAQSQTPGSDLLMRQGGHVRFDSDGSGCMPTDIAAPLRMSIYDGQVQHFNFASVENGVFGYLPGTYEVMPQFENPDYFTVTPAFAHMVLGSGNASSVDFCVAPSGIHRDAEVIVVPDDFPEAGGQMSYKVIVRNKGNQTLNGSVQLQFPGDAGTYVSAFPAPQTRTATTLHWVYNNLQPFATQVYTLNLTINEPDADANQALVFTANVTTAEGDETPEDNVFELRQAFLSPANPNNKICLQGEVAPPSMIGQYLNYVINFENTGNTTVQKVVINDEIDTNQFEITSLQVTNLSHPGIPIVIGNKVEVYFQDIALVPGAQGAVSFKIRTKASLPAGSTVSNKAKIYFDFNFPIETNSALTTFQLLGVVHPELPTAKVYPNPATGIVTIEANHDILSVSLTDAQGRTITELPGSGHLIAQDISAYASGLYCLKITTANGTVTRKLVKQ
jgi:hypothetical protein